MQFVREKGAKRGTGDECKNVQIQKDMEFDKHDLPVQLVGDQAWSWLDMV